MNTTRSYHSLTWKRFGWRDGRLGGIVENRETKNDREQIESTYDVQKVIYVWPLVHVERNRMLLNDDLDHEVWRCARFDHLPGDATVMRVD